MGGESKMNPPTKAMFPWVELPMGRTQEPSLNMGPLMARVGKASADPP